MQGNRDLDFSCGALLVEPQKGYLLACDSKVVRTSSESSSIERKTVHHLILLHYFVTSVSVTNQMQGGNDATQPPARRAPPTITFLKT